MKRTDVGQQQILMLNTLEEVQTQRAANILISLTAEWQKSILNWCWALKASVQLSSLEFSVCLYTAEGNWEVKSLNKCIFQRRRVEGLHTLILLTAEYTG